MKFSESKYSHRSPSPLLSYISGGEGNSMTLTSSPFILIYSETVSALLTKSYDLSEPIKTIYSMTWFELMRDSRDVRVVERPPNLESPTRIVGRFKLE